MGGGGGVGRMGGGVGLGRRFEAVDCGLRRVEQVRKNCILLESTIYRCYIK